MKITTNKVKVEKVVVVEEASSFTVELTLEELKTLHVMAWRSKHHSSGSFFCSVNSALREVLPHDEVSGFVRGLLPNEL